MPPEIADALALPAEAAPPRPAAAVVRAAELRDWLGGEEALRRAEREAEEILSAARTAHAEECRRGYAEGRAAAEAEIARSIARAHHATETALAELEAALPAIVSAVLEDIVGGLDAAALVAPALGRALLRVRRGENAVLRVAPATVPAAREALDGLCLGSTVRLEADPGLAPGRCVFESSLGKAELGIEAQLLVLRETLAERWTGSNGGGS